jgi:hypothetical protein
MMTDEQLRAEFLELVERRAEGELDPVDLRTALAVQRAQGRRRLFLLCGQLWDGPEYGQQAR